MQILFLEDDRHDRQLLEKTLANEGLVCQITHAKTRREFESALEEAEFDLIISDYTLTTFSGTAALKAGKEFQPDTPFIFVADSIGEEQVVETLKGGATDFVLKNRLERLVPAIRRALREAHERKERRRAEERVRVQSSALEAVANGIILTDATGKILFGNKAFCAMTGYALEEILGKTPSFLSSGKHSADFFRSLWNTILTGRVWQGELINRRKDGTLYTEEMTITPVHGKNGVISHFIAVKQDITKQKQRKEQLHQTRKMEAIGQLAGGIAHDFNNLLTVIHGNVQLVLMDEEELKEENRQCLNQIAEATERAADLTRQLLAFGRKQAIRFAPLNPNHVIGSLTKMLKRVIGEHISLRCDCPDDLPAVNADIGMMEQMLLNLIVNARDAMPHGGSITITAEAVSINAAQVESHPEGRTGQFVCITVSDTGTGIYPEYLPRIFEPFFTTKEAGKGTGFGLATVYGIVKQHRGWIEVSSQLGKGTTFKIFLPVSTADAVKKNAPSVKVVRSTRHEKILLVEDDADVRTVTRGFLEGSGYQIWEAANGVEALNVWKTNAAQIDLLLTDVVMPGGLNGWELADRLSGERPDLKVILMSGYNSDLPPKIQPHSLVLPKPFSLEILTETVRNCLDAARPSG
jgi:two-component system, cell cycle sensor histidine kinase and response regulator CckA